MGSPSWDITFRQLEVFAAVVKTGSFGAAAESLNVSQVSISKHIKAMESAMGMPLFERVRGKSAVLVGPGNDLLLFAEMVLTGLDRLKHQLADTAVKRTRVEIAASEAAIDLSFMPQFARFCVMHPNIEVHFHPIKTALSSIQYLDPDRVDFAFLALTDPPDYVSGQYLGEVACDLYATPELARQLAKGLRPIPVIWPPQDGPVSKLIADALISSSLVPYEIVQRVQRLASGLQLALLGLGVCCLSRVQAQSSVVSGKLERVGRMKPLHSYIIPIRSPQSDAALVAREYFSNLIIRDTIWPEQPG